MFNSNTLTIIVASIIALAFIAIVVKAVIDKKKGKKACACGGNCSLCGLCPKEDDTAK